MNTHPRIAVAQLSTEELEAELDRRRKKTPQPLLEPDFTLLHAMVLQGVHTSIMNQCEDDDFEHAVFETVMEAIYGKDFWAWRNVQKW